MTNQFACVWRVNRRNLTYVDPHDLLDGCVKLFSVVVVDSDDMWPADVLLRIRVLRGNLREE